MTSDETQVAPAIRDTDATIADAGAFQRDLYLYWWAAREIGGLALTSRGMLTRPTLRRMRAQWPVSRDERSEADDPRLHFQRRLLERLGLLRVPSEPTTIPDAAGASRLIASDSATMARYLAHPLAERVRICVRLWVAGGWWLDARAAANASARLTPAQPRIALARRRLIETLAALEPGSPIEIPGVATHPDYAPRIIGATAKQRKPRSIAEERNETMRAALAGPLRWLGLVTPGVGDAPGERLLVVSQATLALHNEPDDTLTRETAGRVVIQPNMEIVAYQPLTAPTLFTLDVCAARGALDRVAHYRLSREDVSRAQQGGWSDDEIARRLETLTGSPLPGSVRVRLGDWERAASRIRLTARASVLTTTTPAILDALLADRIASGWVSRRLGPTLALIETTHLEAIRRWLLAHGELPAVERVES